MTPRPDQLSPSAGPSGRAFERLASFAAYVRANPRFDHEERDCKHAIVETVRDLLEAGRNGAPIGASLERLAAQSDDARRPYHLLTPPAIRVISGWADQDEPSLARALARCGEQRDSPTERFAAFEDATSEAVRRGVVKEAPNAMMAFASLINFAVDPQSMPVVRNEAFQRLQRALGYDTSPPGSTVGRYLHHIEFARRLSAWLSDAGIAMRDAMDVQAVIFLADVTRFRLESGSDVPPTTAQPRPGSGLRKRREGPTAIWRSAPASATSPRTSPNGSSSTVFLAWSASISTTAREREAQREVLDTYDPIGPRGASRLGCLSPTAVGVPALPRTAPRRCTLDRLH